MASPRPCATVAEPQLEELAGSEPLDLRVATGSAQVQAAARALDVAPAALATTLTDPDLRLLVDDRDGVALLRRAWGDDGRADALLVGRRGARGTPPAGRRPAARPLPAPRRPGRDAGGGRHRAGPGRRSGVDQGGRQPVAGRRRGRTPGRRARAAPA